MIRKITWLHLGLVAKFFFFNVFLLTLDIGTDMNTGYTYFSKGDYYWGLCTILIIFAPFGAQILFFIFELRKCVFLEFDPEKSKTIMQRLRKNPARVNALCHEFFLLKDIYCPISLMPWHPQRNRQCYI